MARLGPAHTGPARPGPRPEAGAGTSLHDALVGTVGNTSAGCVRLIVLSLASTDKLLLRQTVWVFCAVRPSEVFGN